MPESKEDGLPSAVDAPRERLVARVREVLEVLDSAVDEAGADGRLARLADRVRRRGSQRNRLVAREPSADPSPLASSKPQRHLEPPDEDARTLALSFGTYVLSDAIARRTEGDRGEKMSRVVEKTRVALGSLLTDADLDGDTDVGDALILLRTLLDGWPKNDRVRLLIDLDFGDPFFPYSLKVKERDFELALRDVAGRIGFAYDVVAEIRETRKSAQGAHSSINWVKIGLFGAGGVLLLGTGAFALAPIIGGALGAGAGLSGAAAAAWGLAVLGGGPIATGGAGMAGGLWLVAGGLWLVAGVGAAAGLVGGGGGAALHQLGARQARVELTRLQVTFKMTVLGGQTDLLEAQQIIDSLVRALLR